MDDLFNKFPLQKGLVAVLGKFIFFNAAAGAVVHGEQQVALRVQDFDGFLLVVNGDAESQFARFFGLAGGHGFGHAASVGHQAQAGQHALFLPVHPLGSQLAAFDQLVIVALFKGIKNDSGDDVTGAGGQKQRQEQVGQDDFVPDRHPDFGQRFA